MRAVVTQALVEVQFVIYLSPNVFLDRGCTLSPSLAVNKTCPMVKGIRHVGAILIHFIQTHIAYRWDDLVGLPFLGLRNNYESL